MGNVASYRGFGLSEAQALFDGYTTPQSEGMLRSLVESSLGPQPIVDDSPCSVRSFINELLMRCYPNESAIKASFVDDIILKQTARAVSIFELPVGDSRADFCKVNGHSAAYEIKTDLDTFYRLEKQLSDYYDVFDYVYVITSDARWQSLPDYVPDGCGIYSYHQKRNGRYAFTLRQRSMLNHELDSEKQLSIMPKRDLVIESGLDSRWPKESLVAECMDRYSGRTINTMFKSYLKRRYGNRWEYFKSVRPQIFEIDYEWFYHNNLNPAIIY